MDEGIEELGFFLRSNQSSVHDIIKIVENDASFQIRIWTVDLAPLKI